MKQNRLIEEEEKSKKLIKFRGSYSDPMLKMEISWMNNEQNEEEKW